MSSVRIKRWQDYPSGREKYQLYLASREWAVLKEQVRARSGGTCERCGYGSAVNVHHQTYERIYRERLEDLIHLCLPCHEFLSGKRSADPWLDSPVILGSSEIRTVYLAGKITGTTWRDDLVDRWSHENHGVVTETIMEGDWQNVPRCVPIPDGRRLNLSGPFWRLLSLGNHGCSTDITAPHAYELDSDCHHDRCEEESPEAIFREITRSIDRADLVFAWIDSLDCYGTLVELGYAKARDKYIVVASPSSLSVDARHIWLARTTAVEIYHADDPKAAWDQLFKPESLAI